jgi:hypothetical protein
MLIRPNQVRNSRNVVGAGNWNTTFRVKSLCLTKHHTVETYGGMEVQLHSFLTSGARFSSVVSFTPLPLYLGGGGGKSPQYFSLI